VDVSPNGVDTQAYQMLPESSGDPALLFVGNMGYRPNIDAMTYFCREVLPRIRWAIPNVELWIVGINADAEVQRLAGDGVHVTGRVEDVTPYYERCAACVVPLRAGSGTRLKIVEAMAFGRPVVSSGIGCDGLDVVDEEHLLIADDPELFAEQSIRVLTDRGLRQALTHNARCLVVNRYDWEVVAEELLQIYRQVAGYSTERNAAYV
jgi:glycosyltransferase involved in cell wall biosynthesis